MPVDNTQSPQYPTVSVRGLKPGGGATDGERVEQGHQFLPKTPEASYYDDDGNLLTDGRWGYNWDAENRLISMESIFDNYFITGLPRQRLTLAYTVAGGGLKRRSLSGISQLSTTNSQLERSSPTTPVGTCWPKRKAHSLAGAAIYGVVTSAAAFKMRAASVACLLRATRPMAFS